MTGLLIASPAGSGKGLGRYQSATSSNASREVLTQVMNRTRHNDISRRHTRDESKRRNP